MNHVKDLVKYILYAMRITFGGIKSLGIPELQTYPPKRTLPASDVLGKPLKPQCFMTACYPM